MSAGHVSGGCFSPKSNQVSQHTFENYYDFKNKFFILFNSGSILEINDYCNNTSRGNVSFSELSEIINTLSNHDFAGLDKFKLRSLGEIKEMPVKMNKAKKVTEMKVV